MTRRVLALALLSLPLVLAFAGCTPAQNSTATPTAAAVDTAAIERECHEGYVNAIDSNNLDSLLAMLTEDVVYLSPNEPAVVGKAAVREWGAGYLGAYRIHWDKQTTEFHVAGDWAIERYAYQEADTAKADGSLLKDTGKGLNIYHHDVDGRWRVARDAWNSDLPLAKK